MSDQYPINKYPITGSDGYSGAYDQVLPSNIASKAVSTDSVESLANALKALANCIEAMEMQEGRESGALHIPQHVARKIWDDALEQAHYTVISKGTMK